MSISIVICTYNGRQRIASCINSIFDQVNPPDYELIVVDNASTDGTGEFVNNYLESSPFTKKGKVINETIPGLLFARIAGLKEAKFKWVLFCDDDNIIFPDFLEKCSLLLNQNSNIGVLGSFGIPQFSGVKPGWFDRYYFSFAVGEQLCNYPNKNNLNYVYGACSIYQKNPILTLFDKGFTPMLGGRKGKNMSSGDDVEWCYLMQLMNYKVIYSSNLKFYHQIPDSRLTWEYYLGLKKGISSNSGILSSYEFFYSHSFKPLIKFIFWYTRKLVRSILLYFKYIIVWKGNPRKAEDQLSFVIIKAQMKSNINQSIKAISHFIQLKKYFDS